MLKKICAVWMALIMLLSMAACGKDKGENVKESDSASESIAVDDSEGDTKAATVDENSEQMAWKDLVFEFGGSEFVLPFTASYLPANNWTITSNNTEYPMDYTLEPGEKVSNVYNIYKSDYNPDVRMLVGFVNNGKSAAVVSDCDVWSFVCNIYDEENKTVYDNVPDLKLANGITWGSTSEEILAAYGEPVTTIEGEVDNYTVYTYMYNGLNIMKLTVMDGYGLTEAVLLSYNE